MELCKTATCVGVRALLGTGLLGIGLLAAACTTYQPATESSISPARRGGVTRIRPRCVDVASCFVGQVVAAETATPLARAAVFLEREKRDAEAGSSEPILRLTDDQGVFTVVDAPVGRYRLSVYKDARRIVATGIELGAPGTTIVPVRLPPAT